MLSVNLAFPFLVDSLIVSYWYRRSPEVAQQTALISAEAIATAAFLQGATSALMQRERPYGRDCGKTLPDDLSDCTDSNRFSKLFQWALVDEFRRGGGHLHSSCALRFVRRSRSRRGDLWHGAR
jgi:hypothetical protein